MSLKKLKYKSFGVLNICFGHNIFPILSVVLALLYSKNVENMSKEWVGMSFLLTSVANMYITIKKLYFFFFFAVDVFAFLRN